VATSVPRRFQECNDILLLRSSNTADTFVSSLSISTVLGTLEDHIPAVRVSHGLLPCVDSTYAFKLITIHSHMFGNSMFHPKHNSLLGACLYVQYKNPILVLHIVRQNHQLSLPTSVKDKLIIMFARLSTAFYVVLGLTALAVVNAASPVEQVSLASRQTSSW